MLLQAINLKSEKLLKLFLETSGVPIDVSIALVF
jgi:hypothetical protein